MLMIENPSIDGDNTHLIRWSNDIYQVNNQWYSELIHGKPSYSQYDIDANTRSKKTSSPLRNAHQTESNGTR